MQVDKNDNVKLKRKQNPEICMSKIRLRDLSLGIEVGRCINLSNSNWRGNDCLVVDNLQFRGKYLMGREHVQLLFQNITQKWERDWTIGTMNFEESIFFIICLNEWNLWMLFVLILYMNGICACFYWSFICMESVNFFFYWSFIWMESVNVFSIDPLYAWNMWMFLLILYMNGICECFFIDPLYEWNLWMFYLMFVNWMESMNVFFIVYLYEWNRWMFLYCLLIWMDSVNVVL
jgi:hypothetical protein